MTYGDRAQALLALIEADRATKRAAIIDAARAEARAMLAQAHARAREHVRAVHAEERHRCALQVAAARAELETRVRIASQERERVLLSAAWMRLPDALAQRWGDAASRAAWIDAAITHALRSLPRAAWRIEHAPGVTDRERDALSMRLRAGEVEAQFESVAALRGGLRVIAGHTAIDMTIDGLLADREEIGARALALLESSS